MEQDQKKRAVAEAALAYLGDATVIGVGTGSTVECFIQVLSERIMRSVQQSPVLKPRPNG